VDDVALRIARAAEEFDWAAVDAAAIDYATQLRSSAAPASQREFGPILELLRGHRRYDALSGVIDALLSQGVRDAVVRRLYGQIQIEQGYPAAALITLTALADSPATPESERVEVRGSLGRSYKELYLHTIDQERRADYLRRALSAYIEAYREDRSRYWSGVNAVALLARAAAEGTPLPDVPNPGEECRDLAGEVLDTVTSEAFARDSWAQATAVESYVAVGDNDQAARQLERYLVLSNPNAFALNSLLRQLLEIWNLDTDSPPGSTLLPQLRSELLKKTGGVVLVEPRDVRAERLERLSKSPYLEKVLGDTRYQTLTWYIRGLDRCRSVARIETENQDGLGTGFLVRGTDLHPDLPKTVLITNGHVIPEGLDADAAVVAFHAPSEAHHGPQRFRVRRQWWYASSTAPNVDTTLLELHGLPADVTPVPIARMAPALNPGSAPRAYVIGHPRGLEQPQFSLQDNRILGMNESRLHYRSPTEPGSSGSPVFDKNWDLIALHHAGSMEMTRLDGQPGLYAANEGILTSAIIDALRENPPQISE
jgi:V8-like Glu-specific endopeptidase